MFFTKAPIFVTVLSYALRVQRKNKEQSFIDVNHATAFDYLMEAGPRSHVYVVFDVESGRSVQGFALDPFLEGFNGFDYNPKQHVVGLIRVTVEWSLAPLEGVNK